MFKFLTKNCHAEFISASNQFSHIGKILKQVQDDVIDLFNFKSFLILSLILFLCMPAAVANVFAKKTTSASTGPERRGYIGTLPDLNENAQQSEPEEARPEFEYKDGFNDPDTIKPAPRNNPSFVNIIMKKDKTSQYINDLNSIISIIENLQGSIEAKDNVQKFNAQSYFLKENIDYFRDKYKNKAEESYISFKRLMQLNTHVQTIAQLRLESEIYSPYVSAEGSGNIFTQNNINTQLDYLLKEIQETLVVLKEAR